MKFLLKSLSIVVSIISISNAQQMPTSGNSFISANAQAILEDVDFDFTKGLGPFGGIISTYKSSPRGCFSFKGISFCVGASDSGHVNGYVRSYMVSPFIFPVGDKGKYRPVAISTASNINPIDAAYFAQNPSLTDMREIDIVKVSGHKLDIYLSKNTIIAVSSSEFWDINGKASTKITLTWNENSDLKSLLDNQLETLTIVGWTGKHWESISSAVDKVSIFNDKSTLGSGSITTQNAIIPNDYSVYTFAKIGKLNVSKK